MPPREKIDVCYFFLSKSKTWRSFHCISIVVTIFVHSAHETYISNVWKKVGWEYFQTDKFQQAFLSNICCIKAYKNSKLIIDRHVGPIICSINHLQKIWPNGGFWRMLPEAGRVWKDIWRKEILHNESETSKTKKMSCPTIIA